MPSQPAFTPSELAQADKSGALDRLMSSGYRLSGDPSGTITATYGGGLIKIPGRIDANGNWVADKSGVTTNPGLGLADDIKRAATAGGDLKGLRSGSINGARGNADMGNKLSQSGQGGSTETDTGEYGGGYTKDQLDGKEPIQQQTEYDNTYGDYPEMTNAEEARANEGEYTGGYTQDQLDGKEPIPQQTEYDNTYGDYPEEKADGCATCSGRGKVSEAPPPPASGSEVGRAVMNGEPLAGV
jgi:hypothetical protein